VCCSGSRGMQPVNSIMPTSASHSISDIIDSHCRQQQHVINQPVSHAASDNSYQPQHRDSCISDTSIHQQLAVAGDHDRHLREPRRQPVVIFTDENDHNCLNLVHVSKPQHYQSTAWRETDSVHASNEVDNRQLRERGKPAERTVELDKKYSRATQAVRVGTWSRPVDAQHGHVLLQQVNTLPHTDSLTAGSEIAMQHRYTVQHSSLIMCVLDFY